LATADQEPETSIRVVFPKMDNRVTTMSDQGLVMESGGSRIGWFVAGASSVAAVVAAFLLASAYLSQPSTAEATAELPPVIIEGY
jgi:hypothetical protein